MVQCTIVASKRQLSVIINALYDLELYHVTAHQRGSENLDIGQPLAEVEDLSAALIKVRSILSHFPAVQAQKLSSLTAKRWNTAKKGIVRMYEKVMAAHTKSAQLQEEENLLQLHLKGILLAMPAGVDLAAVQKSRHLRLFWGTLQRSEGMDAALEPVRSDIIMRRKDNYVLLICAKERESAVHTILQQVGFTSLPVEIAGKNLRGESARIERRLHLIVDERKTLQQFQRSITKELPILAGLEQQIQEEVKKQELPLSFAVTKSSFVAQGWIPEKYKLKVQETLEKITDNSVQVSFEKPQEHDAVPVKLQNKKVVMPFEFFLRLFDLPRYNELDPTSLLFITFPLFFGFMLGDVGYGLLLLLLFIYLKKKVPAAKDLASILIFAAVISILFGVIFGEYLGFEYVSESTGKTLCDQMNICLHQGFIAEHGEKVLIYEFPRLLSRVHSHMNVFGFEVLSVLVVGAIIGFFHLNFGLLLGFVNELHYGLWHAFVAKISWMVLQAGIIISVLGTLALVPHFLVWIGVGVALLGILLLALGEGVRGLIEIPALFSTILSYMRLGAVGLASVGLAVVVNEKLALPFLHKGGIYIVVGIIIMLLGHGINLLLGIIGPFLHGIRLHYVEFFSKFYQGGGDEYAPFGSSEVLK